jgi:hypothetical protein
MQVVRLSSTWRSTVDVHGIDEDGRLLSLETLVSSIGVDFCSSAALLVGMKDSKRRNSTWLTIW